MPQIQKSDLRCVVYCTQSQKLRVERKIIRKPQGRVGGTAQTEPWVFGICVITPSCGAGQGDHGSHNPARLSPDVCCPEGGASRARGAVIETTLMRDQQGQTLSSRGAEKENTLRGECHLIETGIGTRREPCHRGGGGTIHRLRRKLQRANPTSLCRHSQAWRQPSRPAKSGSVPPTGQSRAGRP